MLNGRFDYGEVLSALRRITRAIDLHSKKLEKEVGLTNSQLLVMQSIHELGSGANPSAIAREVVLSQPTVTSILDRLERNGLVSRHKTEQDRRGVRIELTESGKERVDDAPELLQQGFLREYRKLPEFQKHLLIASLQQIATMMDAEHLDASPILETGELTPVARP